MHKCLDGIADDNDEGQRRAGLDCARWRNGFGKAMTDGYFTGRSAHLSSKSNGRL